MELHGIQPTNTDGFSAFVETKSGKLPVFAGCMESCLKTNRILVVGSNLTKVKNKRFLRVALFRSHSPGLKASSTGLTVTGYHFPY